MLDGSGAGSAGPSRGSRVRAYVAGLVAGLERKNGWTLAEQAGEVSPDGMQRLLRWADWDVDGVRDDVRDYVIEQLGDAGGVLVADETGFLKKGTGRRGCSGSTPAPAGRTENCQIGVFLAYAPRHGHALIDRELYLPRVLDRVIRTAAGRRGSRGRSNCDQAAGPGMSATGDRRRRCRSPGIPPTRHIGQAKYCGSGCEEQ